jgi:MFS family permease
LLDNLAFPTQFVTIFAVAAATMTMSWFFLSLTREPTYPAADRGNARRTLAGLPAILRGDDNFRRFLAARVLLALGGMGMGFVAVAAVARWGVPDRTVGLYTIALWGGQTVGNLSLGFLADRTGHKLALELGALAAATAFALAWLAPAPWVAYLIFALIGVYASAVIGSGVLVALEFSSPARRPTYVGIANTTAGLANVIAPMLGAWLAGAGYGWTFAVSSAAALAAWVAMRWVVQEPRDYDI